MTEALVVLGDSVVFFHTTSLPYEDESPGGELPAGRGRVDDLPGVAIDHRITFLKSVALRLGVYSEASTSS